MLALKGLVERCVRGGIVAERELPARPPANVASTGMRKAQLAGRGLNIVVVLLSVFLPLYNWSHSMIAAIGCSALATVSSPASVRSPSSVFGVKDEIEYEQLIARLDAQVRVRSSRQSLSVPAACTRSHSQPVSYTGCRFCASGG